MWRFVKKRDLRERLHSYMCHFEKRVPLPQNDSQGKVMTWTRREVGVGSMRKSRPDEDVVQESHGTGDRH